MDTSILLEQLRKTGHRITKVRTRIIGIFASARLPLSAPEISGQLAASHIRANKTTVYREIEFLKHRNLIRQIEFGEGKKRYELAAGGHHHHLVCVRCEKIEDVTLERDLAREEKRISLMKKFKVLNHSLEFFGLCAGCR